jgi:protein TonB
VVGHSPTGGHGGVPGGIIDGEQQRGSSEWTVNDILMNVLTPAKPRYPESLRSAGIDGRVLVQFVVDTMGRVDMNSVKILSATHDLFSRSVRDALGNFRFRPAESGGHRVAALAQMPFEFQITK